MRCWCPGGTVGYRLHKERRRKERIEGKTELSPSCQNSKDAVTAQKHRNDAAPNPNRKPYGSPKLFSLEEARQSTYYFEELDLV